MTQVFLFIVSSIFVKPSCFTSSSISIANNILSGQPDFVADVINFLNQEAGTKFKSTTEANKKQILARANEGHGFEDFQTVIRKKCREWKGSDMAKYLRPTTLFAPSKFEAYLNEPKLVNSDVNKPASHNSGGQGRLVL